MDRNVTDREIIKNLNETPLLNVPRASTKVTTRPGEMAPHFALVIYR